MGFVGLILTGWFIAPLISVRDKSPPDLLLTYFLNMFIHPLTSAWIKIPSDVLNEFFFCHYLIPVDPNLPEPRSVLLVILLTLFNTTVFLAVTTHNTACAILSP